MLLTVQHSAKTLALSTGIQTEHWTAPDSVQMLEIEWEQPLETQRESQRAHRSDSLRDCLLVLEMVRPSVQ